MGISIVVHPFFWFLFRQAALVSFSCHEEHNPADKRHCAHDGRQWHVMCLFASRVNRSDVEDLFRGRVRKASSCKTEQPKHNQDDPKCFVHGGLLRRRSSVTAHCRAAIASAPQPGSNANCAFLPVTFTSPAPLRLALSASKHPEFHCCQGGPKSLNHGELIDGARSVTARRAMT